ncbi:MAG: FAD-dependent oxidoreductase [Sciscionella sp.]
MSRHVVVVGYGMVGARFAEELRRREPDAGLLRVTVLGAETHPAYNRVLLSAVLAGGLDLDAVRLHDADWAVRHDVDVHTGSRVVGVDTARHEVRTEDGSTVDYGELVLATGAAAWIPPVDGLTTPDGRLGDRVAVFRDLDDCARIIGLATPGSRVAVLGGGLLGLEAARGLANRGLRVDVLHPVDHLMERQLDAGAGRVLASTLEHLGITVRLGVLVKRWSEDGGLELDDGSTVDADAVVVSAGVRPETSLADAAGIAVRRGIVVDDRLTTSDPSVHAIGDCAQHPGTPAGLVQSGWEQAAVLADVLTGANPAALYRGTPTVTRLKARGIDLAALGEVHAEDGYAEGDPETGTEILQLSDRTRGRYAKLVLVGDRVIGAILLGTPDAAATIIQLFDTGSPAPSDRLALLLGRAMPDAAVPTESPAQLPARTVVCRCNTVTKKALTAAWRDGARDVAALARSTRAGTGCGSCVDTVRGICEWLGEGDPEPPVDTELQEGVA